jgi:uncharacterized protein (TIGR02271 family)
MRNENDMDRVVPIDELSDYKVADGDPDVRGWDVVSADGRRIGEIKNLLVDQTAMKVRYLDMKVDTDLLRDEDRDRHALIPVGFARLERDEKNVVVDELKSQDVATLPEYGSERLTRDYESKVRQRWDRSYETDTTGAQDFYAHEGYDDSRFYGRERSGGEERMTLSEEQLAIGKRQQEAGEVRVGKHVETERVRKEVPVRREEVTVERREASPGSTGEVDIRDDEIRVPLSEEELVIDKRTVPREELVVRKHEVEDTRTVDEEVRREHADIDRTDEGRTDRG